MVGGGGRDVWNLGDKQQLTRFSSLVGSSGFGQKSIIDGTVIFPDRKFMPGDETYGNKTILFLARFSTFAIVSDWN